MAALLVACCAFGGRSMPSVARSTRTTAVTMVHDELSLLTALSDTFYSAKKAKLQADMNEKLAELEEMEARERALLLTKSAAPAAPMLGAANADLIAELEAEKAKTAALEAQLAQSQLEAEQSLQKVAAFWIAKLAEAKESPVLGAAETTAEPAATATAPPAELVPSEPEYLEEDLSLRELRARLLSMGLSTIGLKAELRARLQYAQLHSRLQYKSWDPETLAWK